MGSRQHRHQTILIVSDAVSQSTALACLPMIFRTKTLSTNRLSGAALDDSSLVIFDLTGMTGSKIAATRSQFSQHPSIPKICIVDKSNRREMMQAEAMGTGFLFSRDLEVEAFAKSIRIILKNDDFSPVPDASSTYTVNVVKTVCGLFDELPVFTATSRPLRMKLLLQTASCIVEALHIEGINVWLDVVNSHHSHTYRHSMLVTGYAAAFAELLEFSPSDRDLFVAGALVHDIGKTKIPLSILDKPGALSPEEIDQVKMHPVYGDEILRPNKEIDPVVLDLIRHHHEYLDGSGYPDGLSGDQIHPMVRMLTLCDVFSALIEKRSYKDSLSPRQAFTILYEMGGKIDKELLKKFRVLALEPNLGLTNKSA